MQILVITDSAAEAWKLNRWKKFVEPLSPHVAYMAYRYILMRPIDPKQYKVMSGKRKKEVAGYVRTHTGSDIPVHLYSACMTFFEDLRKYYDPKKTLLILAGELAHLFFSGHWGLKTWRGSIRELEGFPTITTLSPDQIAKRVQWTPLMRADMTRAYGYIKSAVPLVAPEHETYLNRTPSEMRQGLNRIQESLAHTDILSVDIETLSGEITMVGIGHGREEAIVAEVFAFRDAKDNLLSFEDEGQIVGLIRRVLSRAGTIVGQNFNYDTTYFHRRWGWVPKKGQVFDLLVASHLLDPQQEKSLDVQASLHLGHYSYWKGDAADWAKTNDLVSEMRYNAKDIIATHQLGFILHRKIEKQGQVNQFLHQQLNQWTTYRWNADGVKVDEARAGELRVRLMGIRDRLHSEFHSITGLNPSQTMKLLELFYETLKLKEQIKRKTSRRTLDDEAIEELRYLYPHLSFVFNRLLQYRSYKIFVDNVLMTRDPRGRLTCSYNIAGTDTFRFSSTSNAFNEGGNLQNLTKGDEDEGLPNMRAMVCSDDGWIGFESDLAQADAQVVAWDSSDSILQNIFRNRADLHLENARLIYALPPDADKKDPHVASCRQKAKAGVHATNYGVAPRTLAITLNCTTAAANNFIQRWFALHPDIVRWQKAIIRELENSYIVRNVYGFRVKWLGEMNFHAHHAGLAWRPQSTVAIYIMKIAHAWEQEFNRQVLRIQLQTHDSLRYQIRVDMVDRVLPRLKEIASSIEIPYENNPLVIPLDYVSSKYWGEKE